jgi:hypothetical protein
MCYLKSNNVVQTICYSVLLKEKKNCISATLHAHKTCLSSRGSQLQVSGFLCHLLLALLRLQLFLGLLAVEVRCETLEGEHEGDALWPVELLVEEHDREDL